MGTSRRRSPCVSTMTSSTSTAGSAARSSPAMCSACHRASGDPRVAARMSTDLLSGLIFVEGEEIAERRDEAIAARGSCGVAQCELRLVEELADDAVGEGVDGIELARIEIAEPGPEPLDLRLAPRFGPVPQRHDHRSDLARRRRTEVALELVVDDGANPGDLAGPRRGARRGEGAQVVHVE